MRKKKSTQITVETERHILIRRLQSLFALCEQCGDEVRFVTVNEAAALACLTSLAIYRLIESGMLHHTETVAGDLLVCAISLGEFISNQ